MIAVWFGCDGHPGHAFHPNRIGDQFTRNVVPFGHHIDSGARYPGPDGVARLHHESDWTCLQFGDRTGDRRGGSHTAFLFDQVLTFDEALEEAKKQWPELFRRFNFEIVPEKT